MIHFHSFHAHRRFQNELGGSPAGGARALSGCEKLKFQVQHTILSNNRTSFLLAQNLDDTISLLTGDWKHTASPTNSLLWFSVTVVTDVSFVSTESYLRVSVFV
jgi:hypothetical protein